MSEKSSSRAEENALYFDGEDATKWDAWNFKMLAYAAKKGHEDAFTTEYFVPEKEKDWTEENKAQKVLMKAAWAQIAMFVHGHALKSVMKVKSKNPREAWERLEKEFAPKEILDVVNLHAEFQKMRLGSVRDDPIEWIELLEENNEKVGEIEVKYLKDDFLMISHVFAGLPKSEYESYVVVQKEKMQKLTLKEMKVSIKAHWTHYIKQDDEKTEDAFYGESKPHFKKTHHPKKRFKGDCNKCGKQGHKGVDCRSSGGNRSSANGNDKNKDVTCYKCNEKGHYARECPSKKSKEEFGLFCGMICQEVMQEIEAEKADDEAAKANDEAEGWSFVGMAAVIAYHEDKQESEDLSSDDSSTADSLPSLLTRYHEDSSVSSDDSSMPSLVTRYHEDSSDDESEDDSTSESVKELIGDKVVFVTGANSENGERGPDIVVKWLLDTGASIHADTDGDGVTDEKPCQSSIKIADGNVIKPRGIGAKTIFDHKTGYPLKIKKMHVIPEFSKRIISVSKMIDEGFDVRFGKEEAVIKDKSGKTIKCPKEKSSGLYYLHARGQESVHSAATEAENSTWKTVVTEVDSETGIDKSMKTVVKMPKSIDINKAHDDCGHKGEALLRKTYKRIGVELTGTLLPCEGCGYSKAKAKAVSKTTSVKATKPGERLYLDTTGPFSPTLNGYKFWIQVVDDFTRHGFCEFNKNKKGMGEFIRKLILKLRALGMTTKYLRCDNAGEHLKEMLALCDEFAMVLELTAPDTPQQNGVVERRIVILKQRALAMMIAADLVKKIRELLWCEAVSCANDLENISASTVRDKFPIEMMKGTMSKLYPYFQPFGRVAYICIRKKFKATWKEKSVKHIMVGYAKNHSSDTYRFYNPKTNSISESRDVSTWAEWKRVDPKNDMSVFNKNPELLTTPMGLDAVEVTEPVATPRVSFNLIPDDDDEEVDSEAGRKEPGEPLDTSKSTTTEEIVTTGETPATAAATAAEASEQKERKLERELKKLETNWNPPANKEKQPAVIEELEREVHFVFNTELMTEHGDPKGFWEAVEGPNGDLWLQASGMEAMNFIKRGSWRKKLRSEVLKEGRKIVGTKWVYKTKDEPDGSVRYKGRIVSLGYMQIPGVDYTQSFSPVGNDTSVRIIIGLALYNDEWIIEVIDVEAAFLEGDMERSMFIEWPTGMVHLGFITEEDREQYCIEQLKSMYGNSDAALIYFKLFKSHVVDGEMGMEQSLADPCVFFKKENGKVVLVAVCHVDDNAIAGTSDWIKWFKEGVKKRFGITDLGVLKKHLGIWYEWKVDENGERYVVATMPKLVRQIIECTEKAVGHEIKKSTVPATPGTCLEKNPEGEETLMESEYRSIVGKSMYLVCKLFVEGSNPVRELAKFFSNPGVQHWKAAEKFAGYLKENEENIKLTYRKPKELRMVSSVDSNYATDKESRRSVSGNLHTMGGMITNWLCNTQSNVTLSVTEAEYQSMSKGLQEVLFSQMLINEIAGCVHMAIILEDNTGAIFLVKNQQVGARTKHIDIRHHFLREHWEKKSFYVKYVKSEDNESDILTKNTIEKILKGHAENIRNGTPMAWRDYETTIDTVNSVATAWRENVENTGMDESWIEVCHRPTRKSSLRKSKHGSIGG